MEKTKILNLLKDADYTIDDWEYGIISSIQDKYAQGYLICTILQRISEHCSHNSSEFQEELIRAANYNIWGK